MLKGKHVLFLSSSFFGYENKIRMAIEEAGAIVFHEYGYSSPRYYKYLFKPSSYIEHKRRKYYESINKKYYNQTIDYLFVIEGFRVTPIFVKSFKEIHPNAMTICYNWDSMLSASYMNVLDSFDRNYTFDPKDSSTYGLKFIPTFYCPDFKEIAYKKDNIKYDMIFLGSYKPNRVDYINDIIIKYGDVLRIKVLLYMTPLRFLLEKIKLHHIERSMVIFKPVSFEDYLSLLSKTKAVIDYTADVQTGLPLRIYEALAAHRKLITNNPEVIKEFGDNHNIVLYSTNVDLFSFIRKDTTYVDVSSYSIQNFVKKIFS